MNRMLRYALALVLIGVAWAAPAAHDPEADTPRVPALGVNLQHYAYPYPVHRFTLKTPKATVRMAYMDIAPTDRNGGDDDSAPVVVLLHGKNFFGAYWGATAQALAARGYRVIVPDQIGFGKSDKPAAYSYTFHHLAANTHALLASLRVERAAVLGHSMGGMLATRYALMYPDNVAQLILVDPIGLEDWKAKGVPYRGINAWYAREMKKDYASIRAYETKSYFHGDWRPRYAEWAKVLAGMYAGPDKHELAWAQALTYDTVYTQPVVYEFGDIRVPTTLMVGTLDRTALGKDLVDRELRARLGDYPKLARQAVARIPEAKLVTFEGVGHLPMIEAPARFRAALFDALAAD